MILSPRSLRAGPAPAPSGLLRLAITWALVVTLPLQRRDTEPQRGHTAGRQLAGFACRPQLSLSHRTPAGVSTEDASPAISGKLLAGWGQTQVPSLGFLHPVFGPLDPQHSLYGLGVGQVSWAPSRQIVSFQAASGHGRCSTSTSIPAGTQTRGEQGQSHQAAVEFVGSDRGRSMAL